MPKGSVVVILGRTLHSGGENRTKDVSRWALGVDYCPAWMRQEVNQYLDVPPLVANRLPKPVQQLIGYAMGGETLGTQLTNCLFSEFMSPHNTILLFKMKRADIMLPRQARDRTHLKERAYNVKCCSLLYVPGVLQATSMVGRLPRQRST